MISTPFTLVAKPLARLVVLSALCSALLFIQSADKGAVITSHNQKPPNQPGLSVIQCHYHRVHLMSVTCGGVTRVL